MADKTDKDRRKQLLSDLHKKASEEFEKSLPMSRDNIMKLFGH
jgi:hypothetical protein